MTARPRPLRPIYIAALLVLAALPSSALAQTSVESNAPTAGSDSQASAAPTLRVYSRETIVDVLVTDDKGEPVRDLKQSDFTISEDGHPQPIRSFAEFGAGYTPPPPPLPHRPPYVYTNFEATPATGPVNILLIDAIHSEQVDVVHALRGAERYIVAMPSGTQIAVFWLSDSGLHMLQGFTSDPALLLRAVRTNRTDIGNNGDDKYSVDRLTWKAFDQIAAYVSPIKGRKNLLWFTPGIPLMLSRDGGYAFPDWKDHSTRIPPPPDMTEVHHLMDSYELFASEQIAVSPVDPRGVVGVGWDQLRAEQVAEDTGGEAFYNNNDLKVLIAKAIADGSHFYTLSYIPPRRKEDGHYHTIKVETATPGLHLVYRAGYNSEDPPQLPQHSGADLMHAALEGKAPAVTQLLFDVEVFPGAQPAKASQPVGLTTGKTSVPYDVLFALPQNEIAFTPGPDGTRTGSLQFTLVADDMFGRRVATQSQTMPLPLTADEYREFLKAPFKLSQKINLPPGEISLRLGVLDTTSNKVGTLEIPIFVPGNLAKHPPPPAVTLTGCPPRCPLNIPTQIEVPW